MAEKFDETAMLLGKELKFHSENERNLSKMTFQDYLKEAKSLVRIALPMMMTNLMAFLILSESVIICGQLGKYEMDGASLANSFVNIGGIAIAVGLCTACDTFFSQIFGSNHRKFLGVMLQRSILISITIPFLLIALHINWEPILIALGQDILVAKYTARYLIVFSPGFIFIFLSLIMNRYLQNQYYVVFPMISAIIANIFNITAQYIFVIVLNYGFEASATIQAITYFLNFFQQFLFIYCSGLYLKNWTGLSKDAFFEWGKFFTLALSGMGLVFFEVAAWEIGTFLSGVLGPISLAAQSILFHYETALFQACFALGVAVNIRVGEALGQNNWKRALTTYRVGLIVTILYGLISLLTLFLIKDLAAALFSTEKEIIDLASDTFPYMLISLIFDFLGTITMGALRGCGRQHVGIYLVLIGFYLLGQPIGISLAFATTLGIRGIWIGFIISLSISFFLGFTYTNFFQDWAKQAEKAQDRIKSNLKVEIEPPSRKISGLSNIPIVESFKHRKQTSSISLTPNKDLNGPIISKVIEMSPSRFKKIYIKRALTYVAVLSVFLTGIIIKVSTPSINYIPAFNQTNHG